MNYEAFIAGKSQYGTADGFDPIWMPDSLFPFQRSLVEWAIRRGRAAIFADCGLGKTAMQLTWAENVVRKTNRPVLVLTPLAVGPQTAREAAKFGIEASQKPGTKIVISNYERLHHYSPNDFAGVTVSLDVDFEVEPPDPDVGIMGCGVASFAAKVIDADLELDAPKPSPEVLALIQAAFDANLSDYTDEIEEACIESLSDDRGGY